MALLTLFSSDFSEIKLLLLNAIATNPGLSLFKSLLIEMILLVAIIFVKDVLPELHWKREHHR